MKKFERDSNSLRDYFFSHFGMTKRQRSGFFSLVLLIIAIELVIQFYPFQHSNNPQNLSFTPTEEAFLLKNTIEEGQEIGIERKEITLSKFNPNALDEQGFIKLGFSEKQAKSLIKYRYSLGGNFSSEEEFGAAYVVSDKMFEKLKPYIELKPHATANAVKKERYSSYSTTATSYDNKKDLKPFDPNELSSEGWITLGFSERQVPVILKYKKSLPNQRFDNLEQIKSCFVINDYMYERIKPFIRIKKLTSDDKTINSNQEKSTTSEKLNPNKMTVADWQEMGWDKASAENIVKFKEFIGGFNSMADLEKCKYISADELEKIRNRIVFE